MNNDVQYILPQHTPTQSLDVPWYVSNRIKKPSSAQRNAPTIIVMDVLDKPADPNEVELTEVDKKTPPEKKEPDQLIINVNITFCTHVGWDGVLVMLFSLGIASLFVYITFLYTKKFQAWHRPGVWVFMVFAVLYVVLVVKCLWTWRKVATAFTEEQQVEKDKE